MVKRLKEAFTSMDKRKQLLWLTVFEYILIVLLAAASLGFFYLLTLA
jgi:hypothetical protein